MKVKKKPVEGLHTRLKEIEGAGFVENKKEKNVNRRAGLRDKKARTGEARIKRRKPLTLKHVRRGKRIAATAFSCICVGTLGIVGAGFFMNKDNSTTDKIFNTVCYETPKDGSSPVSHTILENIGYLNYTLQNQEFWYSEMGSTVNAAGFKQSVQNYKQYYESVLISVDIAEGFSQKANQFCVVKEAGVVLWRPSATKKFDGINTKWSEGSAEGCTINEFREKRGFPPSEFSVYVLNENTVLNGAEYAVTDNGDGTFAMTLELSVNTDDEHSAEYYYRQQMMITGDLSTKPVITKTSVTYVFNAAWQVLSFKISDEYTALGGVPCSSETNTVFDYAREKAENSYYNDYFKNYENNFIKNDAPAVSEPKPLDYITAAFTPILQGGAVLNLDLAFDALELSGAAYVELNDGVLSDVRIAIGDISVFIDENTVLYLNDGKSKFKLDIGALTPAVSAEDGDGAATLDTAALIEQLTGGEFTVTEDSVRLCSTLSLFGLDMSLTFDFETTDGKIGLGSIYAEIPFGGKTLKARAAYGTESDIPAKPDDFGGYTDILNEGVSLDITLAFENLKLDGYASVIMDGGSFVGVNAKLGEIGVYYNCPRNMLYLTDGNVKYYLDLNKVSVGETDISSLLGGLDLGGLLAGLTAGDGKITASATLEILEQTVTAALGVNLVGGISLGADVTIFGKTLTLSAALSNEKHPLPDLNGYTDILNEGVSLDISLAFENFKLDGYASVIMDGGSFVGVNAKLGEIGVYYNCPRNMLYLTDGNVKYYLDLNKVSVGETDISSLLGGLDLGGLLAGLTAGDGKITASATLEILEQTVTAALGVNLVGGISLGADVTIFGKTLTLSAALSNEKHPLPDLNGYTDILNEGVSLDVGIMLDGVKLDGTLFVGFENGAFASLIADFGEIKVHYYGAENELYVTVGTTKAFVPLTQSEQGVVNFGDVLGGDIAPAVADLIKNLTTGLKSLSVSPEIKLLDGSMFVNVTLDIENGVKLSADATVLGIPLKLTATLSNTIPADINKEEYVNVFEDALELVDGLLTDNVALSVNGNLYELNDGTENEKYAFSAALEYDKGDASGESGFPVKIEEEDGKLSDITVDSRVYLHFNLALNATAADKDDLYLDVFVLDANPAASEGGFTSGGYTADNELDVYVSVSKYASDDPAYSPLKIYAPMREVLTLLSVAFAALDLDDIRFENSEELTAAVAEISAVIDNLLIDNYLPATKDQFASLGESLIPQILGKSLGEFLGELLAPMLGGSPAVSFGNGGFDPSAAYIKSVTYGEEGFNLVLNSAVVYGAAGLQDTSAEINTKDTDGVRRISDIFVNNVYIGGNSQKLDLGATLGYGETVRPAAETAFGGYRNFDGVDTLIKALVNSATHSKENATDREIEISGLENLPDYILNHYYYVNGAFTVELNIVNLVKPVVNLDIVALSVTIDEVTNEVALNVRLHYKELYAGAAGGNYIVINGESYVDLSIKGGMLYIKREQVNRLKNESSIMGSIIGGIINLGGYELEQTKGNVEKCDVVTYRVYELASLSSDVADIMDLVSYIFNFNDKIANIITSSIADSETSADKQPVDYSGYDYGELLSKYLDYFVYSDDGVGNASWQVSISGQFITDLIGMQTGSPVITFNADYVTDGNGAKVYTVRGLEISPLTIKFLDSVNISMTASGAFEYCNPRLEMREGVTDVTHDGSLLWEETFGCASEGIVSTALWAKALAKSGTPYLSVTPDGAVRLGELVFTLEGIPVADGGKVLYSADGIISDSAYPEWTVKNGYSVVTAFDAASVTVNAIYVANTYSVALFADGAVIETLDYVYGGDLDLSERVGKIVAGGDGNNYKIVGFRLGGVNYSGVIPAAALSGAWDGKAQVEAVTELVEDDNAVHVTFVSGTPFTYGGAAYGNIANVDLEGDYTLAEAEAEGCVFRGWWYNDGTAWSRLYGVENFEAGACVTVEALWVKIDLNGSASRSMGWGKYNYSVNSEFSVRLIGNEEITSAINSFGYEIRSFANGNQSADNFDYLLKTVSGESAFGESRSVNLDGTSGLAIKKYWNIRLDLHFTYENARGEIYESGAVTGHISKTF